MARVSTLTPSSRLGAAAVLSAVVIWAFTNTLIKLSPLPPLTFAVHRLWLGSLILLAVLYGAGRRLTWQTIRASAPGGVLLGIEISFFFSAIKHTSIADVAVISALQPALVLIVAGPLFGERIGRREIAWTGVSLLGVVLVTLGSAGTPAWSLDGDLLAVGSLLAWTAYFLVSKRARASVRALDYMTVVFVAATVVVTPLALASGQPLGGLRMSDLLALVVFVAGASIGHVLLAWAHSSVDVSVSSSIGLAQPVVSALAALLILGEPITPLTVAGGLVVLGSLAAIVGKAAAVEREDIEAELPQT
ncbi:MAG: DMT family transporter [Actinomycetota bacterium]